MDTKKYKILILYFVFFSLIYANDKQIKCQVSGYKNLPKIT